MIDLITGIPHSVLNGLKKIPKDRPVALLLRHAEREALPPNDIGYELPITQFGMQHSYELGKCLSGRIKGMRASPVFRCIQTAEQICKGAGADIAIEHDRAFGDPSIYVTSPDLAWKNWRSMGNEGVMQHMATADHALPGMAHPDEAARALVEHMLTLSGDKEGVHVFVTHDVIVSATTARILGESSRGTSWPQYLEGAFFWRRTGVLHAIYRDSFETGKITRSDI